MHFYNILTVGQFSQKLSHLILDWEGREREKGREGKGKRKGKGREGKEKREGKGRITYIRKGRGRRIKWNMTFLALNITAHKLTSCF